MSDDHLIPTARGRGSRDTLIAAVLGHLDPAASVIPATGIEPALAQAAVTAATSEAGLEPVSVADIQLVLDMASRRGGLGCTDVRAIAVMLADIAMAPGFTAVVQRRDATSFVVRVLGLSGNRLAYVLARIGEGDGSVVGAEDDDPLLDVLPGRRAGIGLTWPDCVSALGAAQQAEDWALVREKAKTWSP